MKSFTLKRFILSLSIISLFTIEGKAQVVVTNDQASLSILKSETSIATEKNTVLEEIIGLEGDYVYLRFREMPDWHLSTPEGFSYFQILEKRKKSTGELVFQTRIDENQIDGNPIQFENCTLLEGEIFMIYQAYDRSDDSTYLYSRKVSSTGTLGSWVTIADLYTHNYGEGKHHFAWDIENKTLQIVSVSGDDDDDVTHLFYKTYDSNLKQLSSQQVSYPAEPEDHLMIKPTFNNGKAYYINYYVSEEDDQAYFRFNHWSPTDSIPVSIPYFVPTRPHNLWIYFENGRPYVEGLIQGDEEEYFSGVFVQSVDLETNQITLLSNQEFEEDFVDDFEDYDTHMESDQSYVYKRLNEFTYADGTRSVVIQRRFMIHTIGSGLDDFTQYAEDYFIVKFDNEKKMEWYRHIPIRLDCETPSYLNVFTSFDGNTINIFFPNHPKNTSYWEKGRTKAKLGNTEASTLASISQTGNVSYANTDQEYNLEELQCYVPGNGNLVCSADEAEEEFVVVVLTEEKQIHLGTARFSEPIITESTESEASSEADTND